jgi:hypothetical protein
VNSVSPALDTRGILFVHQNSPRSKHLCALFVVRSATDMAEASLKCGLYDGHGIFGSVQVPLPSELECGLRFDHTAYDLGSRGWRRAGCC